MELNCKLSIPDVPGLTSQELTVGRHFVFICDGDAGTFNFSKAQLITEPANKNDFVLVKATPGQFEMITYLTGDIQAGALRVTDSVNELTLNIQQFKVASVLPPPEKTAEGTVKPPEPFGYNVLNLNWPHAYTAFFIIVFCAIMAGIITQAMRTRRFRRLAHELKDYDSAIDPDSQFYKHIRLLEKKNYPIREVERQFHIYVIRRYQVPLFGLSVGEATRYLKKAWPTLVNERRDLKNILSDLKKMTAAENPVETKKYLNKLYQFVDRTEEKMGNPL